MVKSKKLGLLQKRLELYAHESDKLCHANMIMAESIVEKYLVQ